MIGGVSLAVDRSGHIYVLWPGADNRPYLDVSLDGGTTWRGPLMVGMPGVLEASPHAQVSAEGNGHIAIAYYGYAQQSSSSRLNGYLTESFNAASARPLFYSAQLNDPKHPLYFPVKSGTLPRNDYLGVTIAPDGTPWTGLVKLSSTTPDSQGYIQSTGFVARLLDVTPKRIQADCILSSDIWSKKTPSAASRRKSSRRSFGRCQWRRSMSPVRPTATPTAPTTAET